MGSPRPWWRRGYVAVDLHIHVIGVEEWDGLCFQQEEFSVVVEEEGVEVTEVVRLLTSWSVFQTAVEVVGYVI